MGDLVLVTGASGFVGLHCVREALAAGYRVRASVRNASDANKTAPIRALQSDTQLLEIVSLELQSEQPKWNGVVAGCKYVLHVASPVIVAAKPSERMSRVVQPAIDGMQRLMNACQTSGSVKRVVITSSIAAVTTFDKVAANPTYHFTEADWCDYSDPKKCGPYEESKTREEQSMLQFVKDNNSPFDTIAINPGYIVGPVLSPVVNVSAEMLEQMFTGKMPFLLDMQMACVDVRDVARLHVKALTTDQFTNQRIIAVTESPTLDAVAASLRKEFGPKGYSIPKRHLPKFVLRAAALFSEQAKAMNRWGGTRTTYDNKRMMRLLNDEAIPIDKSFNDMAYSLIEKGLVPNKLVAK